MFRLTPTVQNLLLINVAVYVLHFIFPSWNIMGIMALRYVESERFAPYQFFTYMFAHSHQGFMHIFFNMLMLVFLGPLLESFWGAKRFLTFYIVTGIGAGILYMGIQYLEIRPYYNKIESYMEQPTPEKFDLIISQYAPRSYENFSNLIDDYYENPSNKAYILQSQEVVREFERILNENINQFSMVGASGAIYGLLMAIALLFPNMTFMLIFPPIPVKAKYLALALGAIAIYSGFNRQEGDNVAHFAHLGGMVFAFIMIKLWQHKGTYRY